MENLFTLGNLVDLIMLVMLQAVLGFDNLLYISLESRRAPADKQSYVRKMGIGLAVIFRIVLLVVLVKLIDLVKEPLMSINWEGVVTGEFNFHAIIVLFGGVFIMYTAIKEIWHMMNLEQTAQHESGVTKTTGNVIMLIVVMNVVFSFDSILSAIALAGDNIVVMATAILIGGLLMILLADGVTTFLEKNRMYEVLGLFILLVVGIMLLSEGGHIAHLEFFGKPIEAMSKTTFYFVIVVMGLTDFVQSRYQRKLLMAAGKSH